MSKSVRVIREGFIEEVMLNLQLKQGVGSARKEHFRQRGQCILQQWGEMQRSSELICYDCFQHCGEFSHSKWQWGQDGLSLGREKDLLPTSLSPASCFPDT